MTKVRVLLAEDHKLVRAGIKALLQGIPWVEVVAEAANGQEAIDLATSYQPDIVLMDISMPKLNGLEAIQMIKKLPDIQVIVLSMHTNKEYVWQALRAGASGYVIKDADVDELEFAIRMVKQEQVYLSPQISKQVVQQYLGRPDELTDFERLTPRQRQILQLVAEGYTTKQIAEELHLGVKTVETHRTQLMQQLDIHDVTGLVRYAIRMGLVNLEE
jgi:DNA-binding NarL/FixJ family response regulator